MIDTENILSCQKKCHQSQPEFLYKNHIQLKNGNISSFSFKNNESESINLFSEITDDEINYLTTICKAIDIEGLL